MKDSKKKSRRIWVQFVGFRDNLDLGWFGAIWGPKRLLRKQTTRTCKGDFLVSPVRRKSA